MMSPTTRLLAMLTALVLFLAVPLSTLAQEDTDEDGSEDEKEDEDGDQRGEGEDGGDEEDDDGQEHDEDERKVKVEVGDDGARIKLERETAASEDKIEAKFEFDDAEFEIKYESEAGDAETQMKLQAQLLRLAEFRDADGDGAYDTNETIVSAWAFSGEADDEEDDGASEDGTVDWLTPTVTDVTVDNQTGKQIRAPARLGSGSFELVMWTFGDFVDLENSTLKPTSVKIDIVIRDYPYEANDTALALFLRTESKSEFEVEHDHEEMEADEEGVAASSTVAGEPVSLVFTWKESALVDGVEQPVRTTTLSSKTETDQEDGGSESERKETFALSYARGTDIVHDPEAYVALAASTAGGVPGWTAPLALAGVAVALVAYAVGRRR